MGTRLRRAARAVPRADRARGAGRRRRPSGRGSRARLSPAALEGWPRTTTGVLKTGAEEIRRLAQDYPEVLPLLEVQKREKRLSTFGAALLDQVSTVTGRLHGDYALPTITGRLSAGSRTCNSCRVTPAPPSVPGPARCCLSADYGQIELRILAERAGER